MLSRRQRNFVQISIFMVNFVPVYINRKIYDKLQPTSYSIFCKNTNLMMGETLATDRMSPLFVSSETSI